MNKCQKSGQPRIADGLDRETFRQVDREFRHGLITLFRSGGAIRLFPVLGKPNCLGLQGLTGVYVGPRRAAPRVSWGTPMLSKEEIEAFRDEADDHETMCGSPSQTVPAPMVRGMKMMSLTTRAQYAMFRAWQNALGVHH